MSRNLAKFFLALCSIGCAVFGPGVASAQDAAAQPEPAAAEAPPEEPSNPRWDEALERFNDALEIFERGDYRGAIAEFERVYTLLEGHPRRYFVLYNLGLTYEELNRYDLALDRYQRYLNEGGGEDEGSAEVRSSLSRLERRLGTIVITLNGPETAEVWVGEWMVGEAPGEIRVPAGATSLELRATGFETGRQQVDVISRQSVNVTFDLQALSTFNGVPPWLFYVSTGLAGAAAIVGTGLGAHTLGLSSAGENCAREMGCSLVTPEYRNEVSNFALATDVTFGVAGLFAVTSIVLIFVTDWDGSSDAAPADGAAAPPVALVPSIGPSMTGLTVLGSF